ncbi:MAG: cellulase family glycosylhydrolase [Planctomycetia bacterium]|nr:cellulase family glycosylhydrolase [Planctomycetia bacterium]
MKKLLSCLLWIVGMGAVAFADEPTPMFPFVISYDAPDNAVNVSHFLDAPAGKDGFVRVKDGQFHTDAGEIRFHATNITGPANFPSHADADKMAARLARLGINCVRMHFMDTWYMNFMEKNTQGILADDTQTQRNLCPKQLDKMDYMIAAFKKRGIYVNLNLHVGRTLDMRDGFAPSSWANKGFGQFVPGMIALQKEYARQLLTHVNPYTGNAYTEEPAVAMIEITNEDSFQGGFFSGQYDSMDASYQAIFQKQWNDWIHAKYPTFAALKEAWGELPKPQALQDEQVSGGTFDDDGLLKSGALYVQTGGGTAEARVADGTLKFQVTKDSSDPFYPKLFQKIRLKKDAIYTLSFRIRRVSPQAGTWQLSASVCSLDDGWTGLGLRKILSVGKDWVSFQQSFQAAENCEKALIQFSRFDVGEYELDDLSFQTGGIVADPYPGYATRTMEPMRANEPFYGQALVDFGQFLEDTETAYWMTMYHVIKDELKAKAPVSGTQVSYSAGHVQAKLDYTDVHGYWRHPSGNHTSYVEALAGREKWSLTNDSMVNGLGNILYMASQRTAGKPYTISEYNHPYPNQFGAEGQPFLAIFGRLQGWNGIFQYSYNHFVNAWEPDENPWCVFDSIARTDVLAHFPACAAMFLRGDVSEAKKAYRVFTDLENYHKTRMKQRRYTDSFPGLDMRLAAVHKIGGAYTPCDATPISDLPQLDPAAKVLKSDTGEIIWNREIAGKGYVAVNTANTKFFTGFPEGRTVDLGGVKLAVGPTRLNWATVSLTDRFAKAFGKGGKSTILIAATGDCGNSGRVVKTLDAGKITLTDRGHGPVLSEGIPAVLTFDRPATGMKCYVLNPRGDRTVEVPVVDLDGKAEIRLDPKYQTVWYELEME